MAPDWQSPQLVLLWFSTPSCHSTGRDDFSHLAAGLCRRADAHFIAGVIGAFCLQSHCFYVCFCRDHETVAKPVAGAKRRWRLPFRCRGSRHESAVAQLSTLGHVRHHEEILAS